MYATTTATGTVPSTVLYVLYGIHTPSHLVDNNHQRFADWIRTLVVQGIEAKRNAQLQETSTQTQGNRHRGLSKKKVQVCLLLFGLRQLAPQRKGCFSRRIYFQDYSY